MSQIRIDIIADKGNAAAALRSTRDEIDKLASSGDKLDNVYQSAETSSKALLATLTGAAMGAAVLVTAKMAMFATDYANEMGKAAERTAVTTEEISALAYQGSLAGLKLGEVESVLTQITKKADDVRSGNEKAGASFARIKLDPAQYQSTASLLEAVAEKISRLPTETDKLNAAMDIFGDNLGRKVMPLLAGGAAGFAHARDEAERFGKIVSEGTAEQAKQFQENLDRLKASAEGLKIELGTHLIPALNDITTAMVEAARESGPLMAAWVGLGGVGAHAFGVDAKSQARRDIEWVTRELGNQVALVTKLNETSAPSDKIAEAEKRLRSLLQIEARANAVLGIGAKFSPKQERPSAPSTTPTPTPTPTEISGPNIRFSGKTEAQKTAEDIAKLILEFERATVPTQTLSEKLQAQLDIYSDLDAGVQTYLQSMVTLVREKEQLNEELARTDELMRLQQKYDDAETARYNAVAASYDAILRETEDLNLALIKSDAERAAKQLEIEHGRRVQRIVMLEAEQDEIDRLLEAETERFQAAQRVLAESAKSTKGFMKDLGATFKSAFEDAIVGGEKFRDVLSGLAQDIERLLVRRTITDPLMSGFDSIVGSLDIGSWFGTNHTGGIVGFETTSMRFASPTIFAGAPRYHSGGIAGDEVPSILKRGEGVFTREQMRNLAPAGVAPSVTVNLIEAPGGGGQVEQRQEADGSLTIDVMVEKIESMVSRNIQRGSGIAPTLERQYGLNRVVGAH